MADSRAGRADAGSRTGGRTTPWWSAAVAGLVIWAGVAKALLLRNLEYYEKDFYSVLEMTWSWHYAGLMLRDNEYGFHGAIHNFYVLPLLSPLTIPLGGYGLILALTVLYLVAALRVARTPALGEAERVVVLAAFLGPVAFFVFDNPGWGFHPDLLYPPLVALLVFDLLEGRPRRALLPAALILIVKEDGAVWLAAVLLVHFGWRLWSLRKGPRDQRRKVLAAAVLTLVAVTAIFGAGMALLAVQSEDTGSMLLNAEPRVLRSFKILAKTLGGDARPFHWERLRVGLVGYGLVAGALLLPLGRRLPRGLALFALSAPIVVTVLVISSAHYRFQLMLWPPRLAPLLALLVACLAHAVSPPDRPSSRRAVVVAAVLSLVSWGVQLVLLSQVGYAPGKRLDPRRLASGQGFLVSGLPEAEVRALRCVAGHLPGGVPVLADRGWHSFFHRQSVIFKGLEGKAWHPPRVRIAAAAPLGQERAPGWCTGPLVGSLAVTAECDLIPRLETCASRP